MEFNDSINYNFIINLLIALQLGRTLDYIRGSTGLI